MSTITQNGDAVAATIANATPSGTLFMRGLFFLGVSVIATGISSKFLLEATRMAAIEGAEMAKLNAA
jgi:hypothetical protein